VRTVYVTMTPTVPYLVDDEEYTDLDRQGLLIPGLGDVPLPATVPAAPIPAVEKEVTGGSAQEGGQVAQADRGRAP